jgi:hypothetical protein
VLNRTASLKMVPCHSSLMSEEWKIVYLMLACHSEEVTVPWNPCTGIPGLQELCVWWRWWGCWFVCLFVLFSPTARLASLLWRPSGLLCNWSFGFPVVGA